MNEEYVWVDSYQGFLEIAKEVGLQFLGYDDRWLIFWKPGTTEGWITKVNSRRCYCNDCVWPEEQSNLREMTKNIGLTTVVVGERDDSYTRNFTWGWGMNQVRCEESQAFRDFMTLYVSKKKREEENVKIRQLLPNAQEELAKRRQEIEKLIREVTLLEEELKKLTQEA